MLGVRRGEVKLDEEGMPTGLCFRERTEARLPKAAQPGNSRAGAPA